MNDLKVDVDCGDCEKCCRFSSDLGAKYSYEELPFNCFPRELCDTLLLKENDKYVISEECRQYETGCKLFDKQERPNFCTLYPLMVAVSNRGRVNVFVDKNCPKWKEIRARYKDKELAFSFFEKIVNAIEEETLSLVFKKDYRQLGYKLKKII